MQEDREILQMIANVISANKMPSEMLKTIAMLLDSQGIEPQMIETLRYWPHETVDRIYKNSRTIQPKPGTFYNQN